MSDSREAFEKAYHKETGLYASWAPGNKGYTDVIAGMCYRMWQAAQAQAGDKVTVKGFANGGSCAVVQGIAVYGLDVGDKLYTRPQPAVQPAVQQAIRAMEWMLCDYEHLNTMGQPLSANWPQRVQAVKDAVAKLQAAQAQAGDGVNQQLLESREIKPYMSDYEQGCVDGWNNYRDAIAAAQEQQRHGAKGE